MKVTGFSFIKNAIKYQYPVVESLRSILPLCDEVVVAVGASEDGTRELVASVDPQKIRIIDTVWDDSLREGGRVLAAETDKAFKAIRADSDWCFYIQGDEVLHENGYEEIQRAMHTWKNKKEVDGLLFNYHHFYGSFDYVGTSSKWYKREIRVIRNEPDIFSYRDAQGFRKGNNEKLRVKALSAYIFHYGWVREPGTMYQKQHDFSRHWSGENWQPQKVYDIAFDYRGETDALQRFTQAHPRVMQERIRQMNWAFEYDLSYNKLTPKEKLKNFIEKITGKRPFDHNNYRII
jgi:glycosyltransferase involved in cell wall biosynthesis